ncbi:hypothetical protein F4861DRAFT_391875 [Xylaria intraflava]|nr:hypothetical protein F4861DRAFT_391875 [Xylaria intraflava]
MGPGIQGARYVTMYVFRSWFLLALGSDFGFIAPTPLGPTPLPAGCCGLDESCRRLQYLGVYNGKIRTEYFLFFIFLSTAATGVSCRPMSRDPACRFRHNNAPLARWVKAYYSAYRALVDGSQLGHHTK